MPISPVAPQINPFQSSAPLQDIDPVDQPGLYFLVGFSNATGIDPRVVFAWMQQEGAFKKGGTGGFNFLNIGPVQGDKRVGISQGGFAQFRNVQDALEASVNVIHEDRYKNVLSTARLKPSPKQQIAAIAASPWDAKHYDSKGDPNAGGPLLLNTFNDTFKSATTYQPPSTARNIEPGSAEQSIMADMNTIADVFNAPFTWNSGLNPIQDIFNASGWVKRMFEWIFGNWDRIFLVIGGFTALVIAVILLYKSQSGEKTFTFSRGD